MKKILALLLIVGAMQGSLLLGNETEDILVKYYIEERNLLGGHDNLEKYLPDALLTKDCLDISRPWNVLYNALNVNNSTDFSACYHLNKEFVHFQQKFLKEVPNKNLINNNIFYGQYFVDNASKHEAMISKVFYSEIRRGDRKVIGALVSYQNALRRSAEDLSDLINKK